MLLGIFSDTHLGFSAGSDDRYEESFARFCEAIKVFREKKVDAILHAGDLFDDAVPTQEVWQKSFECFALNNHTNTLTSLTKHLHDGTSAAALVKGVPIIAIHGTHEYRGKDFSNALQVLEEANCLVHLHAGYVEFSTNGEKVCIHGLGGVPEKHAKEVLQKYSPHPIPGATNLLLLHQSFKEFLPFDDDESIASLSLSDLPDGFDLVIDGHLHWSDEQNISGKKFILTGSTIFTQMKNLESQKPKGVFLFDTSKKQLTFLSFAEQRKLFYNKMNFKEAQPDQVISAVQEKLSPIFAKTYSAKPLVRFKLCGSLAKGFSQSDISIDLSKFSDKAIFSVSKDFAVESFQKKMESLRGLQSEKKSVLDLGVDILEKNIEEAGLKGLDTRRLFELLSVGDNEKAEEVLLKEA